MSLTDNDRLLFEGVMGAVIKGVPLDEAVAAITGKPAEWDQLTAEIIRSFGDLDLVAAANG